MYKPKYRITPYLLKLVDEASSLRAWIEGNTLQVSWLPVLQREARTKNTHSSTAIEGNPLTLNQVNAISRGEKTGVPQIHEKEVTNYLEAMHWIEKNAHTKITEESFLNLHQMLTQNLLPAEASGKYKIKQNFVANEKGVKIYTPPTPEETPGLVGELVSWLEKKETKDLHAILVCAILHHRLVSIHPFSDGNGRIARAIGTWLIFQRGYDTHHIFSLDEFFAGNRQFYYQKIEQARELDDDLTYWIEYVAEGIIKTLKDAKKRIEDLQVSSKHKLLLSPRQEELVRIIRDRPYINVAILRDEMKITRARINQLITPLITSGLVAREGIGKATRYRLYH
ncbi:MAG: Fic family protein [bacterium]